MHFKEFGGTNLSINTKEIIKISLPINLSDILAGRKDETSPDSSRHKIDITCRDARLKGEKVRSNPIFISVQSFLCFDFDFVFFD